MEVDAFRTELAGAPTHIRSWILQERVLPSRRLCFLPTQLYFICRTSEHCEVFPEAVPKSLRTYSQECELPTPDYDFNYTSRVFHRWVALAGTYSRCSFKYPSDKIIVLLGLVSVFQRATGDEYVAGLWKSRLPWTLGWTGLQKHPRRRSALKIAPSWSWLSIDGEIGFVEQKLPGEHSTALCRVLDVSPTSLGALLTDMESGLLTLRALSFATWTMDDGTLRFRSSSIAEELELNFDPDDSYMEITAGIKLTMAVLTVHAACANSQDGFLHPLEGWTSWCLTTLILQHDEVKNLYHRIGAASIRFRSNELATESKIETPPLLEAFGLTTKYKYGEVAVTDHSNWRVLHIV
jgi:hypothetical protein